MRWIVPFVLIMSINTKADELDDWIYSGDLRLGYQNHQNNSKNLSEMALGLNLHFDTPTYKGFRVGATLSSSYGNGKDGFDGVVFFDENNQNYITLREAYIKYSFDNTILVLGRQSIDTPFADSDDIGMIPNSFEAITIVNRDIADTTITLGHLHRWSGVDSDTQVSLQTSIAIKVCRFWV